MSKKEFTPYVSGNLIFYLSYAALFGFWGLSNVVLIPVPVNLIATSTLIILIGCHRSLALLETGDDGKVVIERETISKEDGKEIDFYNSAHIYILYSFHSALHLSLQHTSFQSWDLLH
jgi:hypothetical protein